MQITTTTDYIHYRNMFILLESASVFVQLLITFNGTYQQEKNQN